MYARLSLPFLAFWPWVLRDGLVSQTNIASVFGVFTRERFCYMETSKVLLSSDQDGDKQLSSDNGPSDFSLFRLSTIEDQTSRRKVRTMKEGMGEWKDHEQRKQGLYGSKAQAYVLIDNEMKLPNRAMRTAI